MCKITRVDLFRAEQIKERNGWMDRWMNVWIPITITMTALVFLLSDYRKERNNERREVMKKTYHQGILSKTFRGEK